VQEGRQLWLSLRKTTSPAQGSDCLNGAQPPISPPPIIPRPVGLECRRTFAEGRGEALQVDTMEQKGDPKGFQVDLMEQKGDLIEQTGDLKGQRVDPKA
jgi:hypothetical protein